MSLDKLNKLYREMILDAAKEDSYFGDLTADQPTYTIVNPTCGDELTFQVTMIDDKITSIRFVGESCTIAKASTNLMIETVLGKNKVEAVELAEIFYQLAQGKKSNRTALLGDAAILKGVAKFPTRIKCATLPWKALEEIMTGAANE